MLTTVGHKKKVRKCAIEKHLHDKAVTNRVWNRLRFSDLNSENHLLHIQMPSYQEQFQNRYSFKYFTKNLVVRAAQAQRRYNKFSSIILDSKADKLQPRRARNSAHEKPFTKRVKYKTPDVLTELIRSPSFSSPFSLQSTELNAKIKVFRSPLRQHQTYSTLRSPGI